MAATTCLYAGLAILVIGHARGWWRYLFLIPAIVMPVMIALVRMYRGEHHPTDILASLLFAALWLTAATMLIKPAADGPSPGGRLPHREGAGRSRRVAPGSLAKASSGGLASASASEQRRTG
jgi:undecaprenyl-diphosphatase